MTGHREHLRDSHDLDARAARRRAAGALVRVDRLPAAPGDQPRDPSPQPRPDGIAAALREVRQPAPREIVQQPRNGVGGTLLVRSDDAGRSALDPADGVLAYARRAVFLAHPAALVADQAATLVERDTREWTTAVADRA